MRRSKVSRVATNSSPHTDSSEGSGDWKQEHKSRVCAHAILNYRTLAILLFLRWRPIGETRWGLSVMMKVAFFGRTSSDHAISMLNGRFS